MGVQLPQGFTGFQEQRTAEKTPIIELNGSLPLSDLRDEQQTSGSGSVSDNEAEYELDHTASGDFVRLASASRGRYQPGTIAEVGVGIRFNSSPPTSGDYTARWGLFDMEHNSGSNQETINNGILWGRDKTDNFVEVIRSGTSIHKTYQGKWNGEDISYDLTEGRIFELDYSFYGYNIIRWLFVAGDTTDEQSDVKVVHTFKPSQQTSLANTNLQVGAVLKSSSTTGQFKVNVGGRQYNVVGQYRPRTRTTAESATGVTVGTSGWTQLLSFQKKSGFRQIAVDFQGFIANSSSDIVVRTIRDPSLDSNASFGSLTEIPTGETALEKDTSATDATGGRKTPTTIIPGGSTGQETKSKDAAGEVPVDVVDEGILTIEAQAIDSEATVDLVGKMKEFW